MLDIESMETVMNIAPDSIFFIKDKSRTYMSCNQGLARMCGTVDVNDILGRRTDDFFSDDLVTRYKGMDHDVCKGRTFVDRFDFLCDSESRPVWTLYSRAPVYLETGECAIMGISRRLAYFANSDRLYKRLYIATEWIAGHIDTRMNMRELADICDCSPSQLQRDFAHVLGTSPLAYQAKMRLQYAKDKLKTDQSLASIAVDCGFSEQSGLSRFFKTHTHMTLSEYRKNIAIRGQAGLRFPKHRTTLN